MILQTDLTYEKATAYIQRLMVIYDQALNDDAIVFCPEGCRILVELGRAIADWHDVIQRYWLADMVRSMPVAEPMQQQPRELTPDEKLNQNLERKYGTKPMMGVEC